MSYKETADAIVVLTARSPERILREGGSQAWLLNPARAKLCRWLVCTQNRHNPDHEFSDATEPHGVGFLVGKISAIRPSEEDGARWLIAISEFARLRVPDAWDHGRNPVRYTSLEELGIDPDALEFHTMPLGVSQPSSIFERTAANKLTIADAKKGLAATFGVKPEAIEITIRG